MQREADPANMALPEDPLDDHWRTVIKAMAKGRIVPFLGAGVNLCGRPATARWGRGQYLPSGGELAAYLADNFDYPADSGALDLLRVSQYVAVMNGSLYLYEELRDVFTVEYPATPIHTFLAKLPAILRDKGYPPRYQLIVTTNYDDVLEHAFRAAGEPFDAVTYIAEGDERGMFWHVPPDGNGHVISKLNEHDDLLLDQRTVILKIHGAVDRRNPERDSYVITEDDYLEYLTRTDASSLVPVDIAAKLARSSFLFLGYGLRDWNLRVILYRLQRERRLSAKSWAVQLEPSLLDQEYWRRHDVEVIKARLEDYIAGLARQAVMLEPYGGTP